MIALREFVKCKILVGVIQRLHVHRCQTDDMRRHFYSLGCRQRVNIDNIKVPINDTSIKVIAYTQYYMYMD